MTTTIMAETCCICAGSPLKKWAEYDKSQDPDLPDEPSSWGEIIWDKGEGSFNKKEDPFNSENW